MNRIKTVFQKLWSYETFHIFMYSIALNAVIECLNNRGLTGLLKIITSPVIFSYEHLDNNDYIINRVVL